MLRQLTKLRARNTILFLIALCLNPIQPLFAAVLEPVTPIDSKAEPSDLIIEPVREVYGMTTDCATEVGKIESHTSFYVKCVGSNPTQVTISDDSAEFELEGPNVKTLACGVYYYIHFIFRPTKPGLVVANVYFTSEAGTQRAQLIGNGVPREQADYWIADLGPNTRSYRMTYDNRRALIYMTDYGNDQVIVFSPEQRRVVRRVATGRDPAELSVSPDGRKLYVANSDESSISVIDLLSWEATKIAIPTLYPDPSSPEHYQYHPFAIAVVSDTLALLGSRPPGHASGGPFYQLDLPTNKVTLRNDFTLDGWVIGGAYPGFKTSYDYSTVGIVVEPASSPTTLARYDRLSNTLLATGYGIEWNIAINNNGTRLISTFTDANALQPNLTLFDRDLRVLARLKLLGIQSAVAAFNPAWPKVAYALDGRENLLEEVRVDLGRETRALSYGLPSGYAPLAMNSLSVSPDGAWVYAPLGQTWEEGPDKLLAVRVGPQSAPDYAAPVSQIEALSPAQERNWWWLDWTGSDDISGIDYYQVEYRVGQDTGWRLWTNTTNKRSLFINAIPGQRYYFRVIGVDRAGNIERYPDGAEATTVAGTVRNGLTRAYLPTLNK